MGQTKNQLKITNALSLVVGESAAFLDTTKELHNAESADDFAAAINSLHPKSINVFQLVRNCSNLGRDWEVSQCLIPILGYVKKVTLTEVVEFLDAMDSFPMIWWEAIADEFRSIFRRDLKLAHAVGATIAEGQLISEKGAITWSVGFASTLPLEAIKFALKFKAKGPKGNYAVAHLLRVLRITDINGAQALAQNNRSLLKSVMTLAKVAPGDPLAMQAACTLTAYSDEAFTYVKQRVDIGTSAERRIAATWLASLKTPIVGATEKHVGGLFNSMVNLSIEDAELCRHVEQMLTIQSGKPEFSDVCVDALLQLAHRERGVDLTTMFPTLCAIHPLNQYVLDRLVTCWALLDDYALLPLQTILINCVSSRRSVGIDAIAFNAASEVAQARAINRIASLCANGKLLCGFIESLVERRELQPNGLSYGEGTLNFVIREYPAATQEFLRDRLAVLGRQGTPSQLYRLALARHLRWKRILSRLPVAKELIPSDSRKFTLQIAHSRLSRDIGEQARKMSVLASMATRIRVKQGSAVASYSNNGEVHFANMTTHKGTIEIPSTEQSDPIGSALLRMRYSR